MQASSVRTPHDPEPFARHQRADGAGEPPGTSAFITEREQLKDVTGRFRVSPHLLVASFARDEAA